MKTLAVPCRFEETIRKSRFASLKSALADISRGQAELEASIR